VAEALASKVNQFSDLSYRTTVVKIANASQLSCLSLHFPAKIQVAGKLAAARRLPLAVLVTVHPQHQHQFIH